MSKIILVNQSFSKILRIIFVCGVVLLLTISAVNGRDRLPQEGISYFEQMMRVNIVFYDTKIIEIDKGAVLVHEPLEDRTVLVYFRQIPEEALKEGDWIRIKYDGMILDSDPQRIYALGVKKIKERSQTNG